MGILMTSGDHPPMFYYMVDQFFNASVFGDFDNVADIIL